MDEAVAAQYEALPYPARDPRDEARRLLIGSPSHILEIDHYVFGGQRDWRQAFRALVAGGGTGDAAIMLAQQLADAGCPAEVVHLDLSQAAQSIAAARATARGLTNLRFERASLLDLPQLGLGSFDYIDCCGVLHHLADPDAGLAALRAALAPGGGMGIMLYGRLGRAGVYEAQAIFQALAPDGSPRERVARAKKLLAALPPSHPLVRNPVVRDHIDGGDAGFFDLLLHPRDRAYSVEEIAALAAGARLRLQSFIEPARYDPASYLNDPESRRRIAAMDPVARAALAEKLTGTLARHVCYLVAADNPTMPAAPTPDAVPVLRGSDGPSLARALGTNGVLPVSEGGVSLRLPIPRQSGAIAALIDGTRTIAEIAASLAAAGIIPADRFQQVFGDFYAPLNGVNQLLLRRRPLP